MGHFYKLSKLVAERSPIMMNSANNMYMLLQLDNDKTISEFFLFSIIQVHVIMLLNLITV